MTNCIGADETDAACLHIGLVNNMPDSSLEATERQFRSLLCEAADGATVYLSLFAIPEIPRSDQARRRIGSSYACVSQAPDSHLDGLIVTGAEPAVPNLSDEPFWPRLARLIDWAQHGAYSSIWSCLAAHAAVLRLDGITRRRLPDKFFGVFECAKVCEHGFTAGIPERFFTPHSRWNTIPHDLLTLHGYRVLTRLQDGSADSFIKEGDSLLVFLQGHLEYDEASLLLEYRRDIRRFLRRERDAYPAIPHGYFDSHAEADWTLRRNLALAGCGEQALPDFPAIRVHRPWRSEAVRFYRNWLRYLSEQKRHFLDRQQAWIHRPFPTARTVPSDYTVPETEAG